MLATIFLPIAWACLTRVNPDYQHPGEGTVGSGDKAGLRVEMAQCWRPCLWCHFALCPAGVIASAEEHARAEQLRLAPILAAKRAAAAAERKRWWESR